MSEASVYLDYAATTPLDPQVADFMRALLDDDAAFANPSSAHRAGRRAAAVVEEAAAELAALVNCAPKDLVWTSGATESDNLAIAGAARYRAEHGRHLITMPTEHKAVTDTFQALEKQGFEVTWLDPEPTGLLDLDKLAAALRDDTQLVSIMYVNNETGVVQDIAAIGERCRSADVLFHVDAAQGLGKLPLDLTALPIDLVSMTAHKLYGPKGIGALYIADRPRCHVEPLMFGGSQQRRIRPGTLPVALIGAFGAAARVARATMSADFEHVQAMNERLWAGIRSIAGVLRNGDAKHTYPGILNVSVDGVEGESLLLSLEPLCVATGSACNATDREPSYVLRALGRDDLLAQSAVRFSFGRMTTASEVDLAVERYRDGVARLRSLAPAAAS